MTEHKEAVANLAKLGEDFEYMGTDEFARFWRKDLPNLQEHGQDVQEVDIRMITAKRSQVPAATGRLSKI
jgi:hypothetical protein